MFISGTNPGHLKTLVCAPTGNAAYNIDGLTLHSSFVLPLNQNDYNMTLLSSSVKHGIYCKLKDIKVIIIDEVSMVGSRLFYLVNQRLNEIFNTNSSAVFGNLSVILLGDFHQPSKVGDQYIFKASGNSMLYSELFTNHLWELFSGFELTEIMRQKDDTAFAKCLNNLAVGKLSNADEIMLKSRILHDIMNAPSSAINLVNT